MSEEIRLLVQVDDLRRCQQIEKLVWGIEDSEILSGTHMRALVHGGGMAAGAFVDGELAGFVFGFLARHQDTHSGVGLHSHMLAVLPDHRGRRLGIRLKQFQREWCLQRGLRWITWTFDPLQQGNARLNLEHLAAYSDRYLVDFYGRFGGVLSGDLSTDRLLVTWQLERPEVVAAAGDLLRPPPPITGVPRALRRCEGDEPGEPDLGISEPRLLAALPHDFTAMIAREPERARRWRRALRTVLLHFFARGYHAVRVVDGCYLLEKSNDPSEIVNQI